MKDFWQRYAGRFDSLTLRERAMVAAAALVALLALAYTVLIEPEILEQRRTSAAILQKQSETKALEAQVEKLVRMRADRRESPERERLAALQRELQQVDARIAAQERRFVSPSAVRSLMEGVLARSRGIELVEFRTIAAAPVGDATRSPAKSAQPAAHERPVYRHGLEVSVAGSYLDLLAYLRDLEALPRPLYWAGLQLDAAGYPKVVMKLTVYTLSLERAWLHV